jgi:hypothetical protein
MINGDAILNMLSIPERAVKGLTALQRAGVNLTIGVGLVASIVIFVLVSYWTRTSPDLPALPTDISNLDDAKLNTWKLLLENYKTAYAVALDGPLQIFDQVIVKVLLPLFTLLLGYVFGTNRPARIEGND